MGEGTYAICQGTVNQCAIRLLIFDIASNKAL